MKKFLSILLLVAMMLSVSILPSFAADNMDVRDLSAKGQENIYVGEKTSSAPTVDGAIGANEYSASAPATLNNCPNTVIKDVKHYFAYTDEKIYLAVEMTEAVCKYGTSAYYFNLGFPTAGGFTDSESGLRIRLIINSATTVTPTVTYVDYHNGTNALVMNMTLFKVVTASAAKRNDTTKKTVYEVEIDIEKLIYETGIIFSPDMLFYTYATSGGNTYYYNLPIDTATYNAIKAAYPEHGIVDIKAVPHRLHLGTKTEADSEPAKIETADKAAVKLFDRTTFGIRFSTKIDKAHLDSAISANGKDKIKVGTLIVSEDRLNAAGGVLTHAAVEAAEAGEKYDVIANVDTPYASDADSYTFTGSARTVSDRAGYYYAVGYIKVGDTYEYSKTIAKRAVSGVAFAALRDLSAASTEKYATPVTISNAKSNQISVANATFTAYSSYSKAQVEELYSLASGYNCARLSYFWDVLPKAEGEIRIGCSNVYFHNIYKNLPNGTRAEKIAMLGRNVASIQEMNADVILLQEVSEGIYKNRDYMVQSYLYPQLLEAGYTLVDVEVGDFPAGTSSANFKGKNYTPIWYDADTVTLEACGHHFFDSVRTNPDGGLSSSKSYTWALFTQKSTGKQFAAISTHYTWHSSAEMGLILRNNDATETMEMVAEIEKKYNVPVVVMGDFNSNLSTPAYATMSSANLANARELADVVVNAAYSSSHTYGSAATYMPTFGNPIDHAFASKTGLNITKHQNHVTDKAIAATDHVPLSIDFTIA